MGGIGVTRLQDGTIGGDEVVGALVAEVVLGDRRLAQSAATSTREHRPRSIPGRCRRCRPRSGAAAGSSRTSRSRPRRSGGGGSAPGRPRSTAPASSGCRTRSRWRSRCRPRPGSRPQIRDFSADVIEVVLEVELGGVHADEHESVILVLVGPGTDIGKRPQPVDAGVGPEVDQHDPAAQVGRRQRGRVEPPGRAVETRQVSFNGQLGRGVGGRATAGWLLSGASSIHLHPRPSVVPQ